MTAVLRAGMREYRRNRVLWVSLVAVPAVFIVMAVSVSVDTPGPVALVEGGRHFTVFLAERRMHAATIVPVAAAFLAGLTGLFVVTGSAGGDRRLVLAGFGPARCSLAGSESSARQPYLPSPSRSPYPVPCTHPASGWSSLAPTCSSR